MYSQLAVTFQKKHKLKHSNTSQVKCVNNLDQSVSLG